MLRDAIIAAYEENCPLKRRSESDVKWWNADLQKLRRRARCTLNRAKKIKSLEASEEAKAAQREYRKATKKARRQSWRKFLGELNSIPEVARLKKILAKEGPSSTGAFLKPDGSFTTSWEEEMTTLLDKHFPGCEIMGAGDAGEGVPLVAEHRDWDTASRIITPARVRWALDSFEPFKSPEEDGLFPALLQHGAEELVAPLTKNFRSCIATGYIPLLWRRTRVVFIPKPGRLDYNLPGAFRPICLTSFLLKAVERYIKEGALKLHPLHQGQFAHLPGKSVNAALHSLVHRLEEARARQNMAAGLFLDIEGAFNYISVEAIERAAERHGVDPTIRRWLRNMLSSRRLTICRGGSHSGGESNQGQSTRGSHFAPAMEPGCG
ncbi:lian-aa1 retrotransposon protein [Lasius niger]|uniref:Lian-aa1 retrotransposon protein n=1 Tax=Lasius niger TaxID=67767 RepID=A0A0J7K809_LASNI|nr:lian-aa1 retrotransposon protein [Lasius niger]